MHVEMLTACSETYATLQALQMTIRLKGCRLNVRWQLRMCTWPGAEGALQTTKQFHRSYHLVEQPSAGANACWIFRIYLPDMSLPKHVIHEPLLAQMIAI